MQPTQKRQALQVDIQKVIEAESAMYTRIIADLTRQNAVLSTALDDSEAANRELQAKVTALSGGGPFNPSPFTNSALGRPGAHLATEPPNEAAEAPSAG